MNPIQAEEAAAGKAIEVIARGAFVRNGRLLVCRSVRRGTRYLPGGHVEWGETSPEALRREWREELGAECTVGPFLGIEEQTYMLDGEPVAEISTVFAVECDALKGEGAGEASPETHIRFEWVPLAELEACGLMPAGIRRALRGWLEAPEGAAGRYVAGGG